MGLAASSDSKESACSAQDAKDSFDSLVGKIPWRLDRLPTPILTGFAGGSDDKESTCNVGDMGLIPELGRFPEGRHGNPL